MGKSAGVIVVLIVGMLIMHLAYAQNIGVIIDNKSVFFDASTGAPFIDSNSRTLVPFRVVLEKFGCAVEWNQAEMTAKAVKDQITVQVPIGKAYILVNGVQKANDTYAQVKNGRTYLPIRAVLESFGASVAWNSDLQSVVVDSTGKAIIVTQYDFDRELKVDKTALQQMEKVFVEHVIDGDTVVIDTDEKVRLIGIDSPEKDGPYTTAEFYGAEASAFAKSSLEGQTVYLAKDVSETDQYGRLLRYVYLEDGTFFNLLLLKEGYARAYTFQPDVKYSDVFKQAESYAKEQDKGMWSE